MKPVIVCTEHRGVVFGYAKKKKPNKRGEIVLRDARMCLYWPRSVGGVFGLGEIGPNEDTRISATLGKVRLSGVTAVFDVSKLAAKSWCSAPIQGRE